MSFFEDIRRAYYKANVVEKIIYINVIIFFIVLLFPNFMISQFALPASLDAFLYKPWTLISYAFIHQNFLHIFSNLLILFYIGNLFLDFHTPKQFFNVYFMGIFIGGIAFLILVYTAKTIPMPLGGASAGVTAVFVAIATKIPRYALQLRFIGSVELWVLATIWVALSILQLGGGSNGGAVAHIGGAVFGFLYTQQLFGKNFKMEDMVKKWFQKPSMKTVYRKKSPITKNKNNEEYQQKIDEILDKISKSGYDSLSEKEKEFLFNAGKK